jgi:hypothetical protein
MARSQVVGNVGMYYAASRGAANLPTKDEARCMAAVDRTSK